MAGARYAPLPNSQPAEDAQREMDDAFGDEGDDDTEDTPLNAGYAPPATAHHAPGGYDFERVRDYDFPPPGSPPRPSSVALPGNSIGNSNGVLPSEPAVPRTTAAAGRSLFRRTLGALLPQHYQPLPGQAPAVPGRGGGMMNDGVFANVMAKPAAPVAVTGADGEVYMVPEDAQAEVPPSYAAASADAAPAYYETTVHAPPTLNLAGDMIIDDLPTGPFVTFAVTTLVSWFFQFPGFLLTYLLHGTHAGRFGAQAGLALTLIQFGFGATMGRDGSADDIFVGPGAGEGETVAQPLPGEGEVGEPLGDGTQIVIGPPPTHEWISFLLMTVGWFLLLTSVIGYVRVKRFELSIRAAHRQGQSHFTPAEAAREHALRRNLEEVFGISIAAEEQRRAPPPADERAARMAAEETRLERDLRAAGLL